MTGARERLGFLVGVIVALLCVAIVGVWAVNRPPTDAPSELARAGIPVSAEDMSLDDPELDEEREEQGEGAERAGRGLRARPRNRARPARTASAAYVKAGRRCGPGRRRGWVGEVPIDTSRTTGSRPSRPTRARLGLRPDDPLRHDQAVLRATARSRGSTSRSRTTAGRRSPPASRCAPARAPASSTRSSRSYPGTGAVYALYMNGFNVMFTKSTDHGATWSTPVKTYGSVSWNDKPIIAVSDNGQDVYVAFNGPTGGDPWLAQSHNAGSTWTQVKLVDSNRYDFAFDGDVAPDGTVYFGESSLLYGGGGNKGTTPDRHHRRARLHLARPRRHVDRQARRPDPARSGLHRRRLHAGLLPRPPRRHCRRQRQPRLPLRRGDDGRRQAVDLRLALDRQGDDLVDAGRRLDGRTRRRPCR